MPCNYFTGIVLPWVLGATINHLQIYSYIINWTGLICSVFVSLVCPMFMWAKAAKEAYIFETNFKSSMQMILINEHDDLSLKAEGVNSIDNLSRNKQGSKRGISSNKFLQNCSITDGDDSNTEQGERLSCITETFKEDEDQ